MSHRAPECQGDGMKESIADYFEKHYKISGLKDEDKNDLEKVFSLQSYEKDETIFKENEPGDRMYFVFSGLVKIFLKELDKGKTIVLMKPGDIFGEIAFFDRQPHSAEAMSLVDTEVFILDLDKFNNIKTSNPGLALIIIDIVLKIVAKRLRGTTRKMYGLY